MPGAQQADLDLAITMVREASLLVAKAFQHPETDVRTKPDGSPVTAADLAAEDLIRERLAAAHPEDAVLGEERGFTPGTSGRRWIMDPLGGTASFVRRIPLFSVDLAMEDRHGPAIAVSAFPIGEVLMEGGRGLGSRIHYGNRVTDAAVSQRSTMDGARVCAHNLQGWPMRLLTAVHQRCALTDGVHSVHRLLRGEAEAIVLSGGAMGYDDLACLPVLIQEAGGRVTDLTGRPVLDGDGTVLATNGTLHDEFLELLA
jgi:fructose-1,6-bisphosphatase/inositol monophosphatase family enzyme